MDVYRDGTNASTTLPTIFGPLLGVNSQGVKATAIGLSGNGNATNCLRPLAFADDWGLTRTLPSTSSTPTALGERPFLEPRTRMWHPEAPSAGEFGQIIGFNQNSDALADPITHALLVPLDFHGGGTLPDYQADIEGCNGQMHAIGDQIPLMGLPGVPGTTAMAINDVIAQDVTADWNFVVNRVVNSCAPACGAVSPRLIPVVLFDPDQYQHNRAIGIATGIWPGCPGGTPCVTVSNIIGMFIHDNPGTTPRIHGHMVRYPGMKVAPPHQHTTTTRRGSPPRRSSGD